MSIKFWNYILKIYNYIFEINFSSNHLALLDNTCVLRNVQTDLLKMRKEFDEIIAPFVTKNIQYFK